MNLSRGKNITLSEIPFHVYKSIKKKIQFRLSRVKTFADHDIEEC